MWKDTNFGAQRNQMEAAGLSIGLMYGNGGGQAASTAGGDGMQPSGPKMNPVEGCGYEVNEITFEELLERVKGVFEIIKVEGSVEFLTD